MMVVRAPEDTPRRQSAGRDIKLVHSSDVHVDESYTASLHAGDGTASLAAVLDTARRLSADVVILAGDTFEHHRLSSAVLSALPLWSRAQRFRWCCCREIMIRPYRKPFTGGHR